MLLHDFNLNLVQLLGLGKFREVVSQGLLLYIGRPKLFSMVSPQILRLGCEATQCIPIRDKLEALLKALCERILHLDHVFLDLLKLLTTLMKLLL